MIHLVALVVLAQLDGGAPAELATPPPMLTSETPPAQPPPAPIPPVRLARVFLQGGQVIAGVLESQDERGVTLRIEGNAVTFPNRLVVRVEVDDGAYIASSGAIYFRDPNRTRYLYSPSAMMLKKGEFSLAQVELLLSTFSYGLTDFLTVQAGTAIPVWFIPPFPAGINFVVGAKAGGQLSERFHLAGGFQTIFVPGIGAGPGGFPMAGIAFATATYGTADAHVSFSAGVPFSAINQLQFASPAFSLSANYRVARTVALVSENWLVIATNSTIPSFVLIDSIAARAMGENIAVDVGLVTLFSGQGAVVPFPIPWLTFTYNFN